jgi:hypothetical protein
MEIRIYVPIKNKLSADTKYQRIEGGFWFCETIDTLRRAYQIKERFVIDKQQTVVEVLEELEPEYVSLPCWPLPVVQWEQTNLISSVKNIMATVEHFPEFNVVRFSPKALEETELQDWLIMANISMDELKKTLHLSSV